MDILHAIMTREENGDYMYRLDAQSHPDDTDIFGRGNTSDAAGIALIKAYQRAYGSHRRFCVEVIPAA